MYINQGVPFLCLSTAQEPLDWRPNLYTWVESILQSSLALTNPVQDIHTEAQRGITMICCSWRYTRTCSKDTQKPGDGRHCHLVQAAHPRTRRNNTTQLKRQHHIQLLIPSRGAYKSNEQTMWMSLSSTIISLSNRKAHCKQFMIVSKVRVGRGVHRRKGDERETHKHLLQIPKTWNNVTLTAECPPAFRNISHDD